MTSAANGFVASSMKAEASKLWRSASIVLTNTLDRDPRYGFQAGVVSPHSALTSAMALLLSWISRESWMSIHVEANALKGTGCAALRASCSARDGLIGLVRDRVHMATGM